MSDLEMERTDLPELSRPTGLDKEEYEGRCSRIVLVSCQESVRDYFPHVSIFRKLVIIPKIPYFGQSVFYVRTPLRILLVITGKRVIKL